VSARVRARAVQSREAVRIDTELSATPLARRHEQTVRGKLTRSPKPQPWDTFDASSHPRAALALAHELWLGLARGEYGAVGLFAKVAVGLVRVGAPFDFVHAATQASTDEARHAELCLRMAALCAGRPSEVELAGDELDRALLPLTSEAELDLVMIQGVAMSETLATALLTACQRRASDRLTKSLLTALLGDEVHHARLGWYYLAHRAPHWSLVERQYLADRVGELVMRVEQEFWVGRDAPSGASTAARALGILDSKAQRGVVRETMENEILPGLDALGLGASFAWTHRPRARSRT
jgi:hypothetical protein